MIEEYENWEDSIRFTFIELVNYMDKNSDPLDTLIDFAWSTGADRFWVNNAKDELKRLREKVNSLKQPVAYAQTNEYGDLYDLNVNYNPYLDQTKVVPLYRIK
jgi:hypothetical protein